MLCKRTKKFCPKEHHSHFVTDFRRGAMKAAHSKEVLPQEKRDSKPPRVLCKSTCQKLE
jgi:hypothetical protein